MNKVMTYSISRFKLDRNTWTILHYVSGHLVVRNNFSKSAVHNKLLLCSFHNILVPCGQCRFFHKLPIMCVSRKTADLRKAPSALNFPPKSKYKSGEVVSVWKNMTVQELADALNKDVSHVYKVIEYVDNCENYKSPRTVIDNWGVILEVVKKSGFRLKLIHRPGNDTVERKIQDACRRVPANEDVLVKRPPIVTVMGHVDHGKTTLLDALRGTSVVQSEFGGITQHIGAFSVTLTNGELVTFIDTPGHAAFYAMRSRGAQCTDIIILVVAADDGVMQQTLESLRIIKEAQVPMIVAINKIDKPLANVEQTKLLLLEHGIQLEDYGGDIQAVSISALQKTNLDTLMDAVLAQAEIMELKADPSGFVEGIVIEARTDQYRGKLCSVIIQRGTLRKGAVVVAGTGWGKVRSLFNEQNKTVDKATPSIPVEMIGWRELPAAGDLMLQVESEKRAQEVIAWRKAEKMKDKQKTDMEEIGAKIEEHQKDYKAKLELKRKMGRYKVKPEGPRQKEILEDRDIKVNVLVKADVDGSVEALLDVLETYNNDTAQCKLEIVHYGVGSVSISDIELAAAFNAIIYSFNISSLPEAKLAAKEKNVSIRNHNVIYKLIDDLKEEINAKLPEKAVEEVIGEANVLQEFLVSEKNKKVPVAGCRCTYGNLKNSALFKLVRDNNVLYDGPVKSIKHEKNEVGTVKKDIECGICFKDTSIRFENGDRLLCYVINMVSQQTDWDPGF